MEDGITLAFDNREFLAGICGANDGNLRIIEGSLGGTITARGNEIHFESQDESAFERFRTMMENLVAVIKEGEQPSAEYILTLAKEGEESFTRHSMIQIPHGFNRVYPRSKNQAAYIRGMREN